MGNENHGGRTHWKTISAEGIDLADLGIAATRASIIEHSGSHVGLDETWTDGIHSNIRPRELVARCEGDAVHTRYVTPCQWTSVVE